MDYMEIIDRYYRKSPKLRKLLIRHSKDVADKALSVALRHPELCIDRQFVFEAAMLHDIGVFKTKAHAIHCFGDEPYMRHGILGADLLRNEGLPRHALVCERHIGVGLTKDDILARNLPLPYADFVPVSIEEQVVCFADCFFSKTKPEKEKPVGVIQRELEKYGSRVREQFDIWCDLFL